MTPERKRELDVLVMDWERKEKTFGSDGCLITFAEDKVPNHDAFLKKAANEIGISFDELLEWKQLEKLAATGASKGCKENEFAQTS